MHYMVLKVRKHFQKGKRTEATPGGIAQLVEHLLCKQGVIGSNPFTSTRFHWGQARKRSKPGSYGLIAQLVRAHA